ncbi:MAG: TIR domain-containing protein [Longimicrobiaceae bacterium]
MEDLVVGGPTAAAVFHFGGRIPATFRSRPITWHGHGRYKDGVIHQGGEWWQRWCEKNTGRQRRFKPLRATLVYDTETDMAIYGFEKPGIFEIRIRTEDRPGLLSRVLTTLHELGLEILLSESESSTRGQELKLLCGTSRLITSQEVNTSLLSALGVNALSIQVEGDALTEESLRRDGPEMVEQIQPLLSVFISYSHADRSFVLRLHDFLVNSGVECWLDDHELLPGDRLHETIRSGIQRHDRFLLVCSHSSLQSWWVDNELEEALAKERESPGRSLLVPIDIDGAVLQRPPLNDKCTLIRSRYIGDFHEWMIDEKFAESAGRLFRALTVR